MTETICSENVDCVRDYCSLSCDRSATDVFFAFVLCDKTFENILVSQNYLSKPSRFLNVLRALLYLCVCDGVSHRFESAE